MNNRNVGRIGTPICDFVQEYVRKQALRLHMPGHKGGAMMEKESHSREWDIYREMEALDITEIDGADSLYEADGIIAESEKNASRLFGCDTFYSTEGSSLCIRAMLYLVMLYFHRSKRVNPNVCSFESDHATKTVEDERKRPLILAGRNAHKTFLSAGALLDFNVHWLYPEDGDSYLSCKITGTGLERELSRLEERGGEKPAAVYLTSPDYLGNVLNIKEIGEVCHRHGIFLLVDNAHGAYLRFLQDSNGEMRSLHPIDLGADLCCDSAHKTLPVLTGGAYLHIGKAAPAFFSEQVKNALAMFGSTSPSYLILQSLDRVNSYLSKGYPQSLKNIISQVDGLKKRLSEYGFLLQGDEPLKITIGTKDYGYTGTDFAELLREKNIVCEFADPDFVVMMFTPETGIEGLRQLEEALLSIPGRGEILEKPPKIGFCEKVMTIREAAFSLRERIAVSESLGRVLADASVGCPPAVPIAVCGEVIDEAAIEGFRYYGIESCQVVKG